MTQCPSVSISQDGQSAHIARGSQSLQNSAQRSSDQVGSVASAIIQSPSISISQTSQPTHSTACRSESVFSSGSNLFYGSLINSTSVNFPFSNQHPMFVSELSKLLQHLTFFHISTTSYSVSTNFYHSGYNPPSFISNQLK